MRVLWICLIQWIPLAESQVWKLLHININMIGVLILLVNVRGSQLFSIWDDQQASSYAAFNLTSDLPTSLALLPDPPTKLHPLQNPWEQLLEQKMAFFQGKHLPEIIWITFQVANTRVKLYSLLSVFSYNV